jgi:hypothetical protein
MKPRSPWNPRPAAIALALLAGVATLWPVWNEETDRPLLSSDHAPGPKKWVAPEAVEREGLDPESLFEGAGRNPGSAAHVNAPGRVRADAPAWFELNHLDPTMPDWAAYTLEPRDPEPIAKPDPRFHDVIRMSDDFRADDYPAIATNPTDRDDVWMIHVSYSGRRDEMRLARRDAKSGVWGPWNPVPGVTGDVWRPSLAFDRGGRLWIVWAQQELFDAAFDLYARWFDGERWGGLERLTTAPEGDFDQQVARASDGTLHLAWQGFRDGQSDIFYRTFDGDRWTPEQKLSDSAANDWAPGIATNSKGEAYVMWDTYDRGNYDVVGKVVRAGKPGGLVVVADSEFFEARPSIEVDREDRVWVAYEVGDKGWGKDTGMLIDPERQPGAMLNDERSVQVRIRDGHGWTAPQPEIGKLFPERNELPYTTTKNASLSAPRLALDGAGRMHLVVRALESPGGRVQYWQPYVTTMAADGWTEPVAFPYSAGRLSMNVSAAPAKDGGLWLAWPRDNWPTFATMITFPEETVDENVYAGRFVADSGLEPGLETGDPAPPPFPDRAPGHDDEPADVARVRGWRVKLDGKDLQILRGDTHRHTELSLDTRGTPDGSILDFYRYMLDAAAMDFGLISDHQYGGEREYWWWLEEKLADMFHAPERYVAMFGYERSINWPMGHRNVIHAERGFQAIPFFGKTSYVGSEYPNIRYHNGIGTVQEDDTKLLYEEVRRSGGITIPHTSATTMGTDWRDNDPEIEPLVEIFQGDRHSYEQPGAPLTDTAPKPQQALTAPKTEGFVSNALGKGYKLGFIASSDHLSTHLSYAMVWSTGRSREEVLDAMRARRTYAATDNIVLEFWMGDAFMGGELEARANAVPEIRVKAVGTRPILNAEILRNGQSIYKSSPGEKEIEVRYRDLEPEPGAVSYYYVRLSQVDGQTAWSSPIWVDVAK